MMLESYFQYQADLAARECNMRCPENCDAPGCRLIEVIVEVNLFDLMRLSLATGTPVSGLFEQHCYIGLQKSEFNPRYHQVLIKLKKPCHYFKASRCLVHGSKPLNCILFPEYHQIKGLCRKLAARPVYNRFPCLKHEIFITDHRSKALKQLRNMSRREEALSNHFLFESTPFMLDSKPLTKQLQTENSKNRNFSIQDYDRLLHPKLKNTGLLDSITGKVMQLDSRRGMERFFKKLEDNDLIDQLLEKRSAPEVVYRFSKGHLQRLKRALQRPEVIFM